MRRIARDREATHQAHHAAAASSRDRRQHFNVQKSVEKTPGLAQLLAMGFSEDRSRAALRRHDGNIQAAINDLLASV